ncbi:MAG: hypothetical protein QW717_07890 [Candidatus Bathyarchaeia archaeon]
MRPKGIIKQAQKLEKEWLQKQKARLAEIPADFVLFCERNLNLKLTPYQREAARLLAEHDDVALHWVLDRL